MLSRQNCERRSCGDAAKGISQEIDEVGMSDLINVGWCVIDCCFEGDIFTDKRS